MFVVFDIGTSRLKVSAFSAEGAMLGQVAKRHEVYSDGEFTWQDSAEWWRNACSGFKALMSANRLQPRYVRGFSVSGRAGAGIFVNDSGDVIAEPWSDSRHRSILQDLRQEIPGSPTYGMTLVSKYLWLLENHPDAIDIEHCLYAKDFLLYKLTGEAITDPSSGPDSLSWDFQDRVDISLLPKPALPWAVAGELTDTAARELECEKGIPVAVGAHDGICANTGCAMISEGEYALTLGTHAVSRTFTSKNHGPADRFYCYPPDRHVYGGNSWHIGSTLNWMLTTIAGLSSELDEPALEAFNQQLENNRADPSLVFLPYTGGQTIPERRDPGSGSFHGISLETDRSQMIRAIFQGSAFAIYRTYRKITELTGEASVISLTGGGIVFKPWLQMLSDVFGKEMKVTDTGVEGRGAAVFCAVALGDYRDVQEAAIAMQPDVHTIEPNPLDDLTRDQLERFTELSQLI